MRQETVAKQLSPKAEPYGAFSTLDQFSHFFDLGLLFFTHELFIDRLIHRPPIYTWAYNEQILNNNQVNTN